MKRLFTTVTLLGMWCFALGQTITQFEYFIDKDKGFGKNTKVTIVSSADSTYDLTVDLSGISSGYHKLYIRTKDSKGRWSTTARRNIEVIPAQTPDKIIAGEYFLDTDPGIGKAKKLTIKTKDTAVIQNFLAATAGLKPGFHKLYARFKDTLNHWSMTIRRNVEIIKSLDTIDIAAAEYFFDKDPGFGKATAKAFEIPVPDGSFSFEIAYSQIPPNADTLFIRVKDSSGYWSIAKFAKFSVASPQQIAMITAMKNSESANKNSNTFSFSVSPNPATNNRINVNIYNPKEELLQLRVCDMLGKTIFTEHFVASAGYIQKQLNVSGTAGTYFVYLDDGTWSQMKKIVKE